MVEVAELFKDMDQAVSQEEPVVRKVDESSEQVYSNMVEGGSELGKAVVIGRSRKRKKWWCVLILVLVVVITIVVAVVVTLVVRKSKST
jgi:syntaxin 1B/2/3